MRRVLLALGLVGSMLLPIAILLIAPGLYPLAAVASYILLREVVWRG